jgi:hypothetical protein
VIAPTSDELSAVQHAGMSSERERGADAFFPVGSHYVKNQIDPRLGESVSKKVNLFPHQVFGSREGHKNSSKVVVLSQRGFNSHRCGLVASTARTRSSIEYDSVSTAIGAAW